MVVTQQRLIYTAGTLKLNADMTRCRRIVAYADILRRPPSARYANERTNPIKRFYGYVSLWIGDYVSQVFPLEYDSQVVLLWDNPSLQLYTTILCAAKNTNETIQTLGLAMSPPAPIVLTPSSLFTFPGCPYLWLKFKLEPLTRIEVTCLGEELESCPGIAPVITRPDLPDTIPLYPGDRPLSEDPPRSAPEPGEQPGDTAPATAEDPDASLPAPIPECTPVSVVVSYTYSSGGGGSQTVQVYAPVDGVRPDPSDAQNLQLLCRRNTSTTCSPSPVWININRSVFPFASATIVSVTPL